MIQIRKTPSSSGFVDDSAAMVVLVDVTMIWIVVVLLRRLARVVLEGRALALQPSPNVAREGASADVLIYSQIQGSHRTHSTSSQQEHRIRGLCSTNASPHLWRGAATWQLITGFHPLLLSQYAPADRTRPEAHTDPLNKSGPTP
jgi:hypothetical protein